MAGPGGAQPAQIEGGLSLALLGHDLRAILAEMQADLGQIRRGDVPDILHDRLDRCLIAGEALSRLIDQSVLVCLGQSTPTSAARIALDSASFLSDLRRRWTDRAAESGHQFTLITAGELPAQITFDHTSLDRVLGNLIANALHHTPPCRVTLTLKISGTDLLLIAVEDEGPGFPLAHLPDIERDFVMPPAGRRPGGGLGLQSVKLLVQAMGGRCQARNKASGGAEVSLCLPLRPAEADPLSLPEPAALPNLSGIRILMADDCGSSRDLVALLTRQMGAQIDTVCDGATAIRILTDSPARDLPDVLILDSEMPGASGLQVLTWLQRRGGALADLPVLALTSHIGAAEHDSLRRAGARGILIKPVLCPLELGLSLRAVMNLPPDPAPQVTAEQRQSRTALEKLRDLAGPEAAAELFQKLQEDLTTVQTGLVAAVAGSDLAAIRHHSHVLIALAGTVGATDLHDNAVALNGMVVDQMPPERILMLARSMDQAIADLRATVAQLAAQPTAGTARSSAAAP